MINDKKYQATIKFVTVMNTYMLNISQTLIIDKKENLNPESV